MRCCANCEWCISPTEEDEIMKEQGYSEDDPNRPLAGDCAIGMVHNDKYVCAKHDYKDGMEEYKTYCLYDDKFFSEGYLIIQKLDDEIVRYFKIADISSFDFPHLFIHGYEKNSLDKGSEKFRSINFTITKKDNLNLYNLLKELITSLSSNKIPTIDSEYYGKNHLILSKYNDSINLGLFKDVYGVKNSTDHIDIDIGDNDSCREYMPIFKFYQDLANITYEETTDKLIKTLIKKG